jgi:hypothetical protein
MTHGGTDFLMKILFPFSILQNRWYPDTTLNYLLIIVQFPAYGIILGFANTKRKLIPVGFLLLAIHALAIGSDYAGSYYDLHSPTHQLIEAVSNNDLPTVKNMLNEGADPNTHLRNGCSLLMIACSKGRLEMAKLLLDKGADINYQMQHPYCTALFDVGDSNGEEIIQLLLSKGADVTIKDREGFTVLDRWRKAREFKLKRYGLKEYPASERARDERIISLLEAAAKDQKKP